MNRLNPVAIGWITLGGAVGYIVSETVYGAVVGVAITLGLSVLVSVSR